MRYERLNPLDMLTDQELTGCLRKHINAYQIANLNRLTSGRDHWEWFVGPGAGRLDFLHKQLETLSSKVTIPARIIPRLMSRKPRGKSVEAYVIDGRWNAMCECRGQEVVDVGDPIFVCLNVNCLNVTNKHYPRPVKFPSEKVIREVASILLARPNPINRGWDVAGKIFGQRESIARLRGENRVFGHPEQVMVRRRERYVPDPIN